VGFRKLDRLAVLDNATRNRVVKEALEMGDENAQYRWKCFDEHSEC
jgi:hypothetical protein